MDLIIYIFAKQRTIRQIVGAFKFNDAIYYFNDQTSVAFTFLRSKNDIECMINFATDFEKIFCTLRSTLYSTS